jgi:hypothetical protein
VGTDPPPITLADAVRRAVEVCDPDGEDGALSQLLERFEDADEPIAAIEDIEEVVNEGFGRIDVDAIDPHPEGMIDPAMAMARAVVIYLAFRRDELVEDPIELLTLAARAEFHGEPPKQIAEWLEELGVPR